MNIRFREVALRATFHWKENGKWKQKTEKFMQTLNPFNRNKDGQPKSYEEIVAELRVYRDKWLEGMKSLHPDGERK
jgi:hypothetical protein